MEQIRRNKKGPMIGPLFLILSFYSSHNRYLTYKPPFNNNDNITKPEINKPILPPYTFFDYCALNSIYAVFALVQFSLMYGLTFFFFFLATHQLNSVLWPRSIFNVSRSSMTYGGCFSMIFKFNGPGQ